MNNNETVEQNNTHIMAEVDADEIISTFYSSSENNLNEIDYTNRENDNSNPTDNETVTTTENTDNNSTEEVVEEALNAITPMLIDISTSRFSSAPWFNIVQGQTIIIAGLGGIGSWLSLLIARMKPASIFLYDFDTVEVVNMAGQLYGVDNINDKKTRATYKTIQNYAEYNSVFCMNEPYTISSMHADIMICGFDNMNARMSYFHNWRQHVRDKNEEKRKKCLFIDGRLNAEKFQIFCITGDDEYNIKNYGKNYLFLDEEAAPTVCSYKQTTYCASMIASFMTNLFINFCNNQVKDALPRVLPFFTSYDAEFMNLKMED